MRRSVTLALLAWIAVCGAAFAQGGGLEVFSQAVEMQFPQGYDLYSDGGKLLKTVPGPTSATVQAKASSKAFAAGEVYLSDWSYDQLQQGKQPNWIVSKSNLAGASLPQAEPTPSDSTGLVVYPSIKEVAFPDGYSVFSDNGQLIKTVPGPTSIALKGETGGKDFANGRAYLSDWSYEQLKQGKKPNWLVAATIGGSVANPKVPVGISATAGVIMYPAPRKIHFPHGYTVYGDDGAFTLGAGGARTIIATGEISGRHYNNDTGKLEKTRTGKNKPVTAYIAADQHDDKLELTVSNHLLVREPAVFDSSYSKPIRLPPNITLRCEESYFADGYAVLNALGQQVEVVPGPAWARTWAACHGLPFAKDVAFLSDAGFQELLAGREPLWIQPLSRSGALSSQEPSPAMEPPAISDVAQQLIQAGSVSLSRVSSSAATGADTLQRRRGMRTSGVSPDLSAPSGETILFPEPVSVVFPVGYEVYSKEGNLTASVPGPAKVALRGKLGRASVDSKGIELDHRSALTAEEAASLVLPRGNGLRILLNLNGLRSLPDDVADGIAQAASRPRYGTGPRDNWHKEFISLELNGLGDISPYSATVLAGLAGEKARDYAYETLSLNGLKQLSPEVAEALSRYKGGQLQLNGLTSLSPEAARALSALQVNELQLNGLEYLSDETARALGNLRVRSLGLNGLKSLSENSAAQLGRLSGHLQLNAIQALPPDLAAAFFHSTGTQPSGGRPRRQLSFSFGGLTNISPIAAEYLARYGGSALNLGGVSELEAKTLLAFHRYQTAVDLNGSGESRNPYQSSPSSVASAVLFLTEKGYNDIKIGRSPDWIGLPGGDFLGNYPHLAEFSLNKEAIWANVDASLPRLDGFDGDDPWEQVDDYAGRGVVSDIVYAHHPVTFSGYAEAAMGYSGPDRKPKWSIPHSIAGTSETLEWASGSAAGIQNTLTDSLAGIPEKERAWFVSTLPGIYQAVVDVFRRDLETRVSNAAERHAPLLATPKEGVYLEFYRSPFVHSKRGGWKGGYTTEFADLSATAGSAEKAANKPSFYGVRVYRDGNCVDDVPLFGAVDFEIFVEIMMRNYTRRVSGLSLDTSDEWLQGFFETVYKEIFGKIKKHVTGSKAIYWSADGYFHLLPLDLIAIACGDVDGLSDIPMMEVADEAAFGKASSFSENLSDLGALLVANPEYNHGGEQTRERSIYDDSTVKLVTRAFSNRSLSFADLPGADEEVDRLTSKLKAAGFNNVHLLRNKEASEAALLEKLSKSGMAHIATHGFYLDMTLATDERGRQLFNELKNSANPYFRSGLALAGANETLAEWSKGNVKGAATDGVLLASEVKNLNLKNLSLLVLSACSTAEGKPVDGKSVASLRDAFLQAGVETLVSTLWDIPDDFAAKLMGDFYQRLFAGAAPSVALWHAKKDNFLELRKTTGFAESMVKVAPFVAVTQAAK